MMLWWSHEFYNTSNYRQNKFIINDALIFKYSILNILIMLTAAEAQQFIVKKLKQYLIK